MLSGFRHPTVFQHKDAIAPYNISKSMRNQEYRSALCELMDDLHNHFFAFRINIRGRFIKNIDRSIVEECSCKRKSLLLPSGNIAAVRKERHSKSPLRFHKREEIYLS